MRPELVITALLAVFLIISGLVLTGMFSSGGLESGPTGLFTFRNSSGGYGCPGCNLLIIVVDTLRADHVSSYGYFQETTPVMDAVASQGIRFSRAFSQIPYTPPSHWSMFSGLYPHKHSQFSPRDRGENLVTLPDILEENGYQTAAFTSSPIMNGFEGKFQTFNPQDTGPPPGEDPTALDILPQGANPDTNPAGYGAMVENDIRTLRASETTARVLPWLEQNRGSRFFLFVHYYDPHPPYTPPLEYDLYDYAHSEAYADSRYSRPGLSGTVPIRDDIARYDGEVRFSDANIGTILEKLDELELEDSTLLLILSDHGECFGEHRFSDTGYLTKEPCLFHGKTLYDEEIHIPLIFRNPKSNITGTRDQIVETVDILPTLQEVLGLNTTETDGTSLVPLLEGTGLWEKGFTFSMTKLLVAGPILLGIRTADWKFVVWDYVEMSKKLLFNTGENESRDVISSEPGIAEVLEERLKGMVQETDLPRLPEYDIQTERLLRSLGYIA